MRSKNITGHPNPHISVRAGKSHGTPLTTLGAVPEACFASRQTRGELGKCHVLKFRSHQATTCRVPACPRFTFMFHVSHPDSDMCHFFTCPRVMFSIGPRVASRFEHMVPSSMSSWHVLVPPRVPS